MAKTFYSNKYVVKINSYLCSFFLNFMQFLYIEFRFFVFGGNHSCDLEFDPIYFDLLLYFRPGFRHTPVPLATGPGQLSRSPSKTKIQSEKFRGKFLRKVKPESPVKIANRTLSSVCVYFVENETSKNNRHTYYWRE